MWSFNPATVLAIKETALAYYFYNYCPRPWPKGVATPSEIDVLGPALVKTESFRENLTQAIYFQLFHYLPHTVCLDSYLTSYFTAYSELSKLTLFHIERELEPGEIVRECERERERYGDRGGRKKDSE